MNENDSVGVSIILVFKNQDASFKTKFGDIFRVIVIIRGNGISNLSSNLKGISVK